MTSDGATAPGAMIDVDRADGLLRLTLDRPKSANALHPDAVEALISELSDLGGVEMVVISGNGKHFCAGFDLSDLQNISDGDLLWRFVRIELLLQRVQHMPLPVVAFAHGKVMGAGADLFFAATRRVAAPGTSFRMPGWNFDLALGTRRLTRLIGADAARQALVNSETIDVDAALKLGLVTDIVEPEQWAATETTLREQSRAISPTAMERLLGLTQTDTRTEDLAALVMSASQPGLRDRILAYRDRALR